MLQGYIVQHGEYSYYFVITVNGVNLSKFYFKKQHSWDEKLYGHLVNQVFLPHNLSLSFKLQTPSAHTKKKKETNKKHLSCSPEKGIQILKTKDKEAGKEVSVTATLAHLWEKTILSSWVFHILFHLHLFLLRWFFKVIWKETSGKSRFSAILLVWVNYI